MRRNASAIATSSKAMDRVREKFGDDAIRAGPARRGTLGEKRVPQATAIVCPAVGLIPFLSR